VLLLVVGFFGFALSAEMPLIQEGGEGAGNAILYYFAQGEGPLTQVQFLDYERVTPWYQYPKYDKVRWYVFVYCPKYNLNYLELQLTQIPEKSPGHYYVTGYSFYRDGVWYIFRVYQGRYVRVNLDEKVKVG